MSPQARVNDPVQRNIAAAVVRLRARSAQGRLLPALPSVHRRQLCNREREPLHAVAAEVDLRPCVVAQALERDDHAFAELGVEHALAGVQPLRTTHISRPSCVSRHAKLWWLCTS